MTVWPKKLARDFDVSSVLIGAAVHETSCTSGKTYFWKEDIEENIGIYIYITRVVMEKLNILLFTELMNFEIKIILGKFRINF